MRPDNSPLQTLLAALPDARLAALVIELARASRPPAAAPAPPAPAKRGPGWLKGRPRGPRKIPAATTAAATTSIASPADARKAAVADARRTRKNQARSARRAAARLAKAGNKTTNGTAPAHAGAPAPAPNTASTATAPAARKAQGTATAVATPPKFSISKDTDTDRHVLFCGNKPIGDFETRGEAEKARNLAVIKDTAAHRPPSGAGARPHAAPPW